MNDIDGEARGCTEPAVPLKGMQDLRLIAACILLAGCCTSGEDDTETNFIFERPNEDDHVRLPKGLVNELEGEDVFARTRYGNLIGKRIRESFSTGKSHLT